MKYRYIDMTRGIKDYGDSRSCLHGRLTCTSRIDRGIILFLISPIARFINNVTVLNVL